MGISGRQLATHIGVSEAAVRKAAKAGRIKKLDDGTYDLEAASAAWGRSTDPATSKVRTVREPANPVVVSTEDDAREAVSLIARVLREEGGAQIGVLGFDDARTAETIFEGAGTRSEYRSEAEAAYSRRSGGHVCGQMFRRISAGDGDD